ncbi:hypothetical protein NXY06_13945 [Bacteroides uniformis]|uniref:hypothetical protein n=1 Tax=Bacteroides uniformis TaxID=820 RepID=UPI002164F15E|nr:hypothetical protein [Bacteroides uniformis]MCS3352101.1 hypothetical protein [Bacteroides uniformis]
MVQNNGVSPCLYLLGGQTETEEGLSSCLTDGYVYNPQLGKWSSLGSGFSERNMCCCRQRSQPYTSFSERAGRYTAS